MAQGKSKSSKTSSQYSYHKRKKDARHGKINKSSAATHHLSQPKPENIPSKKKIQQMILLYYQKYIIIKFIKK